MSLKYQLAIANLSCGGCVGRAEAAVQSIQGVVEFSVNLTNHRAQLVITESDVYPKVIESLASAGYPAEAQDSNSESEANEHQPNSLWKIAALLTAPLFVIEMARHAGFGWVTLANEWVAVWNTVQFLLASAVIFGPARGLFTQGVQALWRRAPDMNSLVVIGAGTAFLYSSIIWISGNQGGVYFEASAVICSLILLGRALESGAKKKTGSAIRGLVAMTPKLALCWREGQWLEISASEIAKGERVKVLAGAALPVDGTLQGEGWLDESFLTGESKPCYRQDHDSVYAGSINAGQSSITLLASATGQATAMAGIIAMVQHAQSAKLPIQSLINQTTRWFVPGVLILAVMTFAAWWALGSIEQAILMAVSVLIIACPCAMGLATPTSIVVGMGRAASRGILFKNAASLQQLPRIKTVAFDKTGTLTQGRPQVVEQGYLNGFDAQEVDRAIAGLERDSNHPLSSAFGQMSARAMIEIEQVAGQGLSGLDEVGRRWSVGELNGLATLAGEIPADIPVASADTLVGVVCENQWAGWYKIDDPIRDDAVASIAALKARGIQVVMLSGDRQPVADKVGKELGIDWVFGALSPHAKLARLESLEGPVAFVGDGVNDGPALAKADVGIAIGSGVDVAIDSADVVLIQSNTAQILTALDLGRLTMRNIKQNLGWAFGYNVLLIPVAMGFWGFSLSPMLAAGAMAMSSVCVVGNALRLRWA